MRWIGVIFALVPVLAEAGMAGIGNAQVDAGVTTVHMRHAFITDADQPATDGRWRSRLMVDYGVTDDYAVGIYVQGDRRPHDNLELDAVMLDQRLEYHTVQEDGFYSGARLRYTWKDGDKKPDDAHVRLIAGAPFGDFDVRFNQILGWEMGAGRRSGVIVDSRAQYTYGYLPGHRVGFEQLHNFGNIRVQSGFDTQQHEAGPLLQGRFDTLNYEAGYRYGVSDAAPNHTFRLFLWRGF